MLTRRKIIKLGLGGATVAAVWRGYNLLQLPEANSVVIVGAGATAMITAMELLEKSIPVTMLSVGPKNTIEQARALPEMDPSQGVHIPSGAQNFWWVRLNQVGGRLTHWGAHCPRYSQSDVEDFGKEYPECSWPIKYRELESGYNRIEPLLQIGGIMEDFDEVPNNNFSRIYSSSSTLEEARKYAKAIGANATSGRSAYFDPIGFIDNLLKNPNFSLIPQAEVVRIEMGAFSNKPEAVIYKDALSSQEISLRAKHIVLAANTLSSTKILQASSSSLYSNGLGNASETLGHFLSDHIFLKGTFELPLLDTSIPKESALIYFPRIERGIFKEKNDGFGGMQLQLTANSLGDGSMSGRFYAFTSMRPVYESRCELMPDIASLKIDYHEPDTASQSRIRMRQVIEALLPKAKLTFEDRPAGRAVHEIGTCKMGYNPSTSMVNSYGRLHEIPEISVVDGSILPSQPEKNPTLTFMALASRSARELAKTLL